MTHLLTSELIQNGHQNPGTPFGALVNCGHLTAGHSVNMCHITQAITPSNFRANLKFAPLIGQHTTKQTSTSTFLSLRFSDNQRLSHTNSKEGNLPREFPIMVGSKSPVTWCSVQTTISCTLQHESPIKMPRKQLHPCADQLGGQWLILTIILSTKLNPSWMLK